MSILKFLQSLIGIPDVSINWNKFEIKTVYRHGTTFSHFLIGIDSGAWYKYLVTLSEYRRIIKFIKQELKDGEKLELDCQEDVWTSDTRHCSDKFKIRYRRNGDMIIISFSKNGGVSSTIEDYRDSTMSIEDFKSIQNML